MINDLLNYALKNGIQIQTSSFFSPTTPSVADTESKSIIINMNCKNQQQLPFIIAHEISHILNCDQSDAKLCFSTLLNTKYEFKANCGAIELLVPYYLNSLDNYEQANLDDFMKMFAIPVDMQDICKCKIINYVQK
ncbi:ImmA/IrrE family metallo-endopeptidase [Fructilactobacillus florum]|nr:ImmA/IrrE family metallo-endopeptidase [Fructilactobacillus florum]